MRDRTVDRRAGSETDQRIWCGAIVPDEIRTLPHERDLRVALPLSKFVRGFQISWGVLAILLTLPIAVFGFPEGTPYALPFALAGVFVLTREPRWVLSIRPGSRWVRSSCPTAWSVFRVSPDAAVLRVERVAAGWTASISIQGVSILKSAPTVDRDELVARVLPFAQAIRREMGGTPIASP